MVLVFGGVCLPQPVDASPRRWVVLVYDGIGTASGALVLGRAVEDRGLDAPKPNESTSRKMTRLRRMIDSHPLVHTRILLRTAGRRKYVKTDARGFFRWKLRGPLPTGTHRVEAELTNGARHRVFPGQLAIFPKKPGTLWVSDIDDTVLKTGVRNKARMIKGLLTHNALELDSYPGAPNLMRRGVASGRALAFVSGSPWQLQPRLRRFMAHRGLPRAPLFLKRIGLGEDTDALFGQGEYKKRQLERLLSLLPGYRVVCFGDSGEHDPEVYRALQRRHPKRVVAVLIHDVGGLQPLDPRVAGQFRFKRWKAAHSWLRAKGLLTPLVQRGSTRLPKATTSTRP